MQAYLSFLFVVEEVTVPPEPPPLLRRLALHDEIECSYDRIHVFDLVDVGHIAVQEPEQRQ